MKTRQSAKDIIDTYLCYDELPTNFHHIAHDILDPWILSGQRSAGMIIRYIFISEELQDLSKIPKATIAKFCRCSCSLVTRYSSLTNDSLLIERKSGRPKYLTDDNEQKLSMWLKSKCESKDWPSISEFKKEILSYLDQENSKVAPCKGYYYSILYKIIGNDYVIKKSTLLEEDRYQTTSETIQNYFNLLRQNEIDRVNPAFLINLDECGIGSSKSSMNHKIKVIVPRTFVGSPSVCQKKANHFVTCLAAATASGELLKPAFILKRTCENADATKMSFCCPNGPIKYVSQKAFVTKSIFGHYVRSVIFDYILKKRMEISQHLTAVILYDGHYAHVIDELKAFAANKNIKIIVFPPHSSHLVQPLDTGIFRRLKSQFSSFEDIEGASKISSILEKLWMSYQATNIPRIIWNAFTRAGLEVIIKDGIAERIIINENNVLNHDTLNHFIPNERLRGERNINPEGFLNEDEMMLKEAGLCPLCCYPLRNDE